MPGYTLNNLEQCYGARRVLHLPQFTIEAREILALVGPSGAGKSTLLRLLNFLETPTRGELWFDGHLVPGQAPLHLMRRVTTVFQRPLAFGLSVWDNVALGLRWRGAVVPAQVDEALHAVGLAHLARRAARTLSGGELQRVALARALAIRPEVLLLDEPTANLDPHNVGLIEDIIRAQHRARALTVVLVTHHLWQARRLAQRVALLWEGELVEVAPTAAFFEAPTHPRSQAFLRGDIAW